MTAHVARLSPGRVLACVLLTFAAVAGQAATARACSLNGIASIAMNGTTASLTEGTPSQVDAAHWAPFTLPAAAPGDSLHLSEDVAKVGSSLSAEMLRTPFRWVFDDGAVAKGYAVTHRFKQLGWHKVTVEYYYPARRQWLTFDSAQLHIVSASALFWTNLPRLASQVLLLAMRAAFWILLGIIVTAMAVERLRHRRRDDRAGMAGDDRQL